MSSQAGIRYQLTNDRRGVVRMKYVTRCDTRGVNTRSGWTEDAVLAQCATMEAAEAALRLLSGERPLAQ